MNKKDFMLKSASKEWNGSDEWTRASILKDMKVKNVNVKLRFSQLSTPLQNRLAMYAQTILCYESDWNVKQNKERSTE